MALISSKAADLEQGCSNTRRSRRLSPGDGASPTSHARPSSALLDDPAFGEHRARYWLDVARYADTNGYHLDEYRSIWPYRDYVIDAFASGKAFDAFTLEQLAGDLLPNASVEQRIATGFIRAAMSTDEGGAEEDEYAAIYAKYRVDTMAGAWLGLTVGCAACHDHRYDPITQKDFYALTAFFRNTTQPIMHPDTPPSILVPPSMTPTLVVVEKDGEPFAHVLGHGRYDEPGERVTADVPASLLRLGAGEPPNRLGLARWLTGPDHPLTARVVVNRFWSELFGAGLVRTANDFGRIGDAPSHPELLDWLAVELLESGWDVKHLFRLMVTSATYRQSAQVSPEELTLDADNRLLSRGPRFRMDGEMVRDLALAASGLLVRTVGGPSVRALTRDDYGRDHHSRCLSMWLAGGGVRPGIVYGETDDFSYNVVENEVPLRDLHATVLHLFGLDPDRLTFLHAGLPERLIGVGAPARVVHDLIA